MKETRNSRWRAYAKGCLDVCDRYSKRAMDERAKLQDVAPKDVKQLEVLRPVNTPSMGERYKAMIEKEKRLEAATRPVQKHTEKSKKQLQKEANDSSDEDEDVVTSSKTKKKKKSKAASMLAKKKAAEEAKAKLAATNEDEVMGEEDEVKEGIDWSDDEF